MRSTSRSVDIFGQAGHQASEEVLVPVERALRLQVNGELAAVVMRQPGDDLELAAGYCLTEGLVTDATELLSARHCEEEADSVDVLVVGLPVIQPRWVGTDCIDAEQLLGELPPALATDLSVTWLSHQLPAMPPQFRDHQKQHKQSGGVHGAALFDCDGELVVLREDIGRNNAVDKVVGYSALHKLSLAEMALMVSGRASASMVLKAVRAGVPLLATMSNTTSQGWELADHLGLPLITYLRGKSFRLCTHAFRIRAALA